MNKTFTVTPSFQDFIELLIRNDGNFHTTHAMPDIQQRALSQAVNREYIQDDIDVLYRWWLDGWVDFDKKENINA